VAVSTGFVAESVAAGTSGQIYVAGHQGNVAGGTGQSVLQRLNPDGSLETFFGVGGQIISPTGYADYAVAVDSAGRVVTAGVFDGHIAVSRYLAGGQIDRRFGHNGQVLTSIGNADAAYAVAVAPDGSIVAAGTSDGAFAFVRYGVNGALNRSFGKNGVALIQGGTGQDVVGGVAFTSDGGIVAAGAEGASVVVLRLNADGSENSAFGTAGVKNISSLAPRTDLSGPDHTEGIAVQSDGKIVVANRTAGGHFGVVRLNTDGAVDASFGSGGLATIAFGGDDDADAVAIQATGQIIVVGTTSAGGGEIAAAALQPNGVLDPSFGSGGKYTTSAAITVAAAPAGTLAPQAIHIGDLFLHAFGNLENNGRLIVGASSDSSAPTSSSLRRLIAPGAGSLGTFGNLPAAAGLRAGNRPLKFVDYVGSTVTLSLKGGGTCQAMYDDTQVDLVITGAGVKSVLSIQVRGGPALNLGTIRSDGPLKQISAPGANLNGTLYVPGPVGRLLFGSINGVIAVSGAIGSLTVFGNISGAKVLSGTTLGSDGQFGGTATAADSFSAGSIGAIRISGHVANSVIAAGLRPAVDSNNKITSFLGAGAKVMGGTQSAIGPIVARGGIDAASRFVAGSFGGKVHAPGLTDVANDPRFSVL
jgi:uncharacterized delta-60 repeat protein